MPVDFAAVSGCDDLGRDDRGRDLADDAGRRGAAGRAPLRASVLAPAVGSLDYLLRPYLIKGGADLPLLLILVGVIGGLISLEIIGLFVGLTVLAVT